MSNITIGICGSPSSGKTTASQLLRWKLREITKLSREVPREYARHYMEKYGPITNIHQQLLVFDGQTKSEKQISDTYDMTISDSPRFLAYVYAKNFFDYKNKHSTAALVRLYELALNSIEDYEVFYLLPPADSIEEDGIRIQTQNDAVNLYNDISNFLYTHCKEMTVFVKEHTRDEPLKTVEFIINDLQNKGIIHD